MSHYANQVLSFRSYDVEFHPHTHGHLQIVLPVAGAMEIDIERRGKILDASVGAVIMPNFRHGQVAQGANRFLVVDLAASDTTTNGLADRFTLDPYFRISTALRRLVDYIELSAQRSSWMASNAAMCMPLLLDAIANSGGHHSRLDGLAKQLEDSIHRRWTVTDMAIAAGVSSSRLHSLFKTAFGQSPNRYLAALRLSHALRMLSSTNVPVSQVAQDTGYSDQSALTRAMRTALGTTPAKFRRHLQ
ncbi:helix-turn-helix domain-containing protein [Phenylobacterium sp. 20VBR1]|uniref:Helix-turn-helix domain-containing protein n=1 Tax=Phenylobacterium glaciei TaxID=2803784 RepID=A0A941HVS9_9CAUL|nr:AraC family transcriptional regulator [Phenylobacterium glaciei]MBR7620134.1 helix-turn-helix domain-containing protein [Phenylobacterium glaciei]QQZ49021.1 helix-turn-helix domain-containing protein [Phenylobacterium glaciei]